MKNIKDRIFNGSIPEPNTGCWIWYGAVYRSRGTHEYGVFSLSNRTTAVHRASYEAFKEPIPNGLVCRHTCDMSICVNPDHLVVGTQAQNVQDMWNRGRSHHQVDPSINVRAALSANATLAAEPQRRATGDRHGMWRRPQNGSSNGFAKINETIAQEIYEIGLSGLLSQRAIAAKFGVHQTTVCRIMNGARWTSALRARAALKEEKLVK